LQNRQKLLTFTSTLIVIVLTLPSAAEKSRDKGKELRAELASLQKETGVTLSAFALSVGTLQFSHRSRFKEEELGGAAAHSQDGDISPHGTKVAFAWSYYIDASGKRTVDIHSGEDRLGIVQTDGTGLREFPAIADPKYFCWSPDESKLAIYTFAHNSSQKKGRLVILDLHSNGVEEIATGAAFLTPQCWAPDGHSLVYGISELGNESNRVGEVATYNFADKTTKILANGAYPTWSADKDWITFLVGEDYYIIRASGSEKKLFLRAAKPRTGLLWSPDGRFVAYGVCCKYQWTSPDTYWRFYVRRLRDNAEDWVADVDDLLGCDIHWVQPLNQRNQPADTRKSSCSSLGN
jgi:dipeptidyl aminopeptidase/acylaminoacyl peptidase